MSSAVDQWLDACRERIERLPPFWVVVAIFIYVKLTCIIWAVNHFDFVAQSNDTLLSIWSRWDAGCYDLIATQGYFPHIPRSGQAFIQRFPPLYPLLMAAMAKLTGFAAPTAGILVSLAASLTASWWLFRLALVEGASQVEGLATVVLFNAFPTAYFTHAPYAEGVFLLCVTGTFLAVRLERWHWAGLAVAGAFLSRIVGIALLPAMVWVVYRRWRNGQPIRPMLPLAVWPAVGMAAYLGMNQALFGHPLHFLHAYGNAGSAMHARFPLSDLVRIIGEIRLLLATSGLDEGYMMHTGWNPVFWFFCLGTVLTGLYRKPAGDMILYALVSLLIMASVTHNLSYPRYCLALIPAFLAWGRWPAWAQVVLYVVFVGLQCHFAAIFVRGGWAF